MKRILVVRGGAIGDFILTLPAIKLLRDAFPQAELEILGYKHIVALAANRFYADAVQSIEYAGLAGFFARGGELSKELADYFAGFDLVVSYLFDPDNIFEQNVRRCGVQTFIACSPRASGDGHAAQKLAAPLEQLGLGPAELGAHLFPSQVDRDFARAFHGATAVPTIALHPGSGGERKNWPIENWRALGESLLRENPELRLLLVAGEADQRQLAALQSKWSADRFTVAENLPLPHLAAVLEQCAIFIGHDSGVSHIAAAVGTPCLLLFGPTDPEVWAPANANVRALRAPSGRTADVNVDEVANVATDLLAARSS